jgi:hypothetical protein
MASEIPYWARAIVEDEVERLLPGALGHPIEVVIRTAIACGMKIEREANDVS